MAQFKTYSRSFSRYSDLVLGGVFSSDLGHSFREVNLVKTDTMVLGSILDTGNLEVAAGSGADAVKVLVWVNTSFDLDDIATGETFTAVVAVRGVTLNRFLVVYSDGSQIDDDGVEALESHGLKVTEKVLVTS